MEWKRETRVKQHLLSVRTQITYSYKGYSALTGSAIWQSGEHKCLHCWSIKVSLSVSLLRCGVRSNPKHNTGEVLLRKNS